MSNAQMHKLRLSSSYLLAPPMEISCFVTAFIIIVQTLEEYSTMIKNPLATQWYDFLNVEFMSFGAVEDKLTTFLLGISIVLFVHTVVNLIFIVSIFLKIVSPEISLLLQMYVLLSELILVGPLVNAVLPFLILTTGSCSMYSNFCLTSAGNVAIYIFLMTCFAIHLGTLTLYSLSCTPDDFEHSKTMIFSGFLLFAQIGLHITAEIIAINIHELYQTELLIAIKLVQALISGFFPLFSNKYLCALQCASCVFLAVFELELYLIFPMAFAAFMLTLWRTNYVIEKALIWLIAERRHVHERAADLQFDIDYCFNPNFFFVLIEIVEEVFMSFAVGVKMVVQSFFSAKVATCIEIWFRRFFKSHLEVPERYEGVQVLQFASKDLGGITSFLLQKYYFYQIQRRGKAADRVGTKIVFFSALDFCTIEHFLVEQYELYYACQYFDGKQSESVFEREKLQMPYARALAYIAESEFGRNTGIELYYIISLRYELNNIEEAEEMIDMEFEVDDRTKEEKLKKFEEYEAVYQHVVERAFGGDFELEEALEEARTSERPSFRMRKLELRMTVEKNTQKEISIIERLLQEWDELDATFVRFWEYPEGYDASELLLHIYEFKKKYSKFLDNIKAAKRMSSGLFLFDVFMCAANRYFQLDELDLKLYHEYQAFRVRFEEGEANIIIDGDQNFKVINHFHPSYYFMKRRYGIEPEIIITQENNQVQERTFEQNVAPVSVGQIECGNESTTTYGPDEKCELDSLEYHFENGIRRFTVFSCKRSLVVGFMVLLLVIVLVVFPVFLMPETFSLMTEQYEKIVRQSSEMSLFSDFLKSANVLYVKSDELEEFYSKIVVNLKGLASKIHEDIHLLEDDLKPFILYSNDYHREETEQTSFLVLKAVLMADQVSQEYLSDDSLVLKTFREAIFPMSVYEQYPLNVNVFEFDYLFSIIFVIIIIPFAVVLLNGIIEAYLERDFALLTLLFQLLPSKLRDTIGRHYASFAEIRKRYNEIYGNSNVSEYLDVVIGGNYFDSEVITDLTFEELLKTYQNTEAEDASLGIPEPDNGLLVHDTSVPSLRTSLMEAFLLNRHFKEIIDIILICTLVLLSGIVTAEFEEHQNTRNIETEHFHHLREQFFRFSEETIPLSYLRQMYIDSSTRVATAEKFEAYVQQNSMDATVLEISNSIYYLGSITQQTARGIEDMISFASALRNLELIAADMIMFGPHYTVEYDYTDFELARLLRGIDDCEFVGLTDSISDRELLPTEIDEIINAILFGCFVEKLNYHIFKLIEYVDQELEYEQEYHYIEKLKSIVFTKHIVANYFNHNLGYNRQESLYIWPYVNVNHPAYSTSHRSSFYKKTDYMVQFVESMLPANASSEFVDFLAEGSPVPKVLSWDITIHFIIVIFAVDAVLFAFLLMYVVNYRKWSDVIFMLIVVAPIVYCQASILRFKESEYILAQETTYLNYLGQIISEDYTMLAQLARHFIELKQKDALSYFEENHSLLVDIISRTTKYHSISNIGRNLRYPKLQHDELLHDQFLIERLLFVALGEVLPTSLNGTLQTNKSIDIDSLNINQVLRPVLYFADHAENFLGLMNKIIAHMVTCYETVAPQDYAANFKEFEQYVHFGLIREIMEFDQGKIDNLFLNKPLLEDYDEGTIIPSLGWYDGHLQWSGYNYFEEDGSKVLLNSQNEVRVMAFSEEQSLQLEDLFGDISHINMLTKQYCKDINDNKAITLSAYSPLLFYLTISDCIILGSILCVRALDYIRNAIIKESNVDISKLPRNSFYRFFKPAIALRFIPFALFGFIIAMMSLLLLELVFLYRENQLVFAQWSVSNIKNDIEKLEGVNAALYFELPCEHRLYGAYTEEYLLASIQEQINHLLTFEDIPHEAPVVYFNDGISLLIESTEKSFDHLPQFSAGSFYSVLAPIQRAFREEYISVPLVELQTSHVALTRAYLGSILGIRENPEVLIREEQIFDSILVEKHNFSSILPSEELEIVLQMKNIINNLWSDIDHEISAQRDVFYRFRIGTMSLCVIFALLLIVCWTTSIFLCAEGKFLRYLLKKLRTEDFAALPAIYSDIADV